jgi:hypothetical protein
MVVAAYILHEHHAKKMSVYRSSTKGSGAPRDQVDGHARLYRDYFHLTDPVYKEHIFWQRYRMPRDLFMVVLRGVGDFDPYFQCSLGATGKLGFTSYKKCSAAIHMLSYEMSGACE